MIHSFKSKKFILFIISIYVMGLASCTHESVEESMIDPNCALSNITYSKSIVNIFTIYCNGCHGSSPYSGNINLSTFDDIKYIALNGDLVGVIKHQAGYIPMPQGGGRLTDCEIRIIEKWISNGVPNN